MTITLDQILRAGREAGASDVHLVRGIAPAYRVSGDIRVAKAEPLDEEMLRRFLGELLNEKQQRIFEEQWQLCFSREWPGVGRFRTSAYYRSGCPEMSIRLSESVIRNRE
ncbi:MAG: hypothetical protein ABSH20_22610 [Tepidisphaeraceae bacterium]